MHKPLSESLSSESVSCETGRLTRSDASTFSSLKMKEASCLPIFIRECIHVNF